MKNKYSFDEERGKKYSQIFFYSQVKNSGLLDIYGKTVLRSSAMEENAKIQTLSNDLVRRLCTTVESMGAEEHSRWVWTKTYQQWIYPGANKEDTGKWYQRLRREDGEMQKRREEIKEEGT